MNRTCFKVPARLFQLRTMALGLSAARRGKPVAAPVALCRKGSLLADQRGAVAFEMLIVYSFMLFSLLLPTADLAIASFQFISAWEALRGFGQYVQYNPPSDAANPSSWWSGLKNKAVGNYPMSPVNGGLLCGDAGAACSSTNIASPKYYSYTTTVTLAPMVLKSVLCTGANANCVFKLSYSERFQ